MQTRISGAGRLRLPMNPSTPQTAWNFHAELEALAQVKMRFEKTAKDELIKNVLSAETKVVQLETARFENEQRSLIQVLKTGYALEALKLKIDPSRAWVAFTEKHLSTISKASIYRYLKLASTYPDPADVPAGLTITAAYRLIDEHKAKENRKRSKSIVPAEGPAEIDLPNRLSALTEFVSAMSETDFVASLTPEQREPLATQIEALVKILAIVQEQLAQTDSVAVCESARA